jgi:hypothetical protein
VYVSLLVETTKLRRQSRKLFEKFEAQKDDLNDEDFSKVEFEDDYLQLYDAGDSFVHVADPHNL